MKTNQSVKFLIIIIFIILSARSYAQTTNFAGHWVINVVKSDFQDQSPDVMYRELFVRQTQDSIIVAGSRFDGTKPKSPSISYPLNGKQISIINSNNQVMVASVSWDKQNKVLTRSSSYAPVDDPSETSYLSNEAWSLSEDRQKLTLARTFTMSTGQKVTITALYEPSKN